MPRPQVRIREKKTLTPTGRKKLEKKYFSQLQKRFSRPSESSARSAEFFDAKVGLEAFFKLKTILEGK